MNAQGDVLRAVVISVCVFFASALIAMIVIASRKKVQSLVAKPVSFDLQIAFGMAYVLLYVVVAIGRWADIGRPLSFEGVFSLAVMLVNAIVVWVIVKENK